ncbi:MAG: hypothetical protein QOG49_1168 [Frankiaceae bacterium]|nr:hypothetical protein [Frankiaceae bacterium]
MLALTKLRRLGCAGLAAAACAGVFAPTAANAALPRPGRRTPAHSSTGRPSSGWRTPAGTHAAVAADRVASGAAVIAEAATFAGTPYHYGATGPNAYDCSSYVREVFRHFGVELPRTSAAQRAAVPRVPAGARQPGDLIFFHDGGGHVYHMGIYAGGDDMWVAPSEGKSIMREHIWSSAVSYGRVH